MNRQYCGVYGLLQESCIKLPENIFVRSGDNAWTYHQVDVMSAEVSCLLVRQGLKKGERVIIFCDNSINYIAAYFGILRLGAIAVPVNPVRTAESVEYIIEKCSPAMVLACSATIGKLRGLEKIPFSNILNIDVYISFNTQAAAGLTPATRNITAEEPAMILFTSGTTAYPKGVTLTHGNLLANTEAILNYLKLTCEDSILMTLPFTYSYGNSVLLTHASIGASITIDNNSAYPYRILEGLGKYRVSGFSTVGSYINLILKCIRSPENTADFPESLRYITFAGESTNNDDVLFILNNYPGIRIFVMYGQTEASARLSYLEPEQLPGRIGSIGRGLSNTILKVADADGKSVEPGETGEILARGPCIMKGYWNDPEATREVLKDGWLYTGDSATVDADGFIYIKGRKTDMIKHMGHRISPVEIESVINSCRLVKESAVIEGIMDGMPIIKAFIVTEEYCTVDEIRKYVNTRLPTHMRPQVFEIIDWLPRTDSGKIRRSALRSR